MDNAISTQNFTRLDTKVLKGIAVTLLVFHHCFRIENSLMGFPVSFFPLSREQGFMLFSWAKICVSLFVFISGFGLATSLSKSPVNDAKSYFSFVRKRYLSTFSSFWAAYIAIFIGSEVLARYPEQVFRGGYGLFRGIANILFDMLGLSYLLHTPMLSGVYWYMSLALLLIVAAPIFYWAGKKIGFGFTLLILLAIPRLIPAAFVKENSFVTYDSFFLLGMWAAAAKSFPKVTSWFSNLKAIYQKALTFSLFLLNVLAVCIYSLISKSVFWEFHIIIAPTLFILLFWFLRLQVNAPGLERIAAFFGDHSMNIFYVHNIFRVDIAYATSFKAFSQLLYAPQYFLLIGVNLLLLSTLFSLVLQEIKRLIARINLV